MRAVRDVLGRRWTAAALVGALLLPGAIFATRPARSASPPVAVTITPA